MRAWLYLLGGMLIWAIDFFALYIVASVFHTSGTARLITLAVTLLCLCAAAWLARSAWRRAGAAPDPFGRWTHKLAAWTAAAASVAIVWQGLPALLI